MADVSLYNEYSGRDHPVILKNLIERFECSGIEVYRASADKIDGIAVFREGCLGFHPLNHELLRTGMPSVLIRMDSAYNSTLNLIIRTMNERVLNR